MTSKRLYYLLLALIVVLFLGLIGGAYLTSQAFSTKAKALTALKAKNQALSQEKVSLAKAKQDLKKYADLQKISKQIVPEDKNQAAAVREIVNIAAANNVSLAAINFPASTLGGDSIGGTAKAVPSASASKKLTQVEPVKNIPGVYLMPITVQGNPDSPVEYFRFTNFLKGLEHNRRTAQVSSITLNPDKDNPALLTFSLNLSLYIKP